MSAEQWCDECEALAGHVTARHDIWVHNTAKRAIRVNAPVAPSHRPACTCGTCELQRKDAAK